MNVLRLPVVVARLVVQTVLLAIQQIWANRVRSLLTTLGIIIGVASIIAVISALSGLRSYVLTEFENLGAKRIFIDGDRPLELRNRYNWREVQLTLDEVVAIVENSPSVVSITPIRNNSYAVEYGPIRLEGVATTGIWPTWH